MKYIVICVILLLAALSCERKSKEEILGPQYTTPEYFDFGPTWTADGGQLVFSSTRNHHPTLNLFVMNKDGSDPKRLTFESEGYGSGFPDCSPDGKRMAFLSDRETGFRSLYIMDVDGSHAYRLSGERDTLHTNIDFSRDGKLVYAQVSNAQGSDIYAYDISTKEKHRITEFDWGVGNPNVSPDGNRLAVTTGRWGNPEIEIYDLRTKKLERLTESWSDEGAPIWSNDGNYVYMYSNIDEPMYETYRVHVPTKTWERISDSPNWDLEARISPRGELAFHSTQNGRNSITVTDSLGNQRTILTNKTTTPFVSIIEKEDLTTALAHYPKEILDSLHTTYILHEEMLGLAARLIRQNKREKAMGVLDYIVDNIRSVWPDMTARYYQKLGVPSPMTQGAFFRYVQENGVEAGKRVFEETVREFPGRRFLHWYEMLMFAYSYHYAKDYSASIALLKMNLELYPGSFQTLHDLGQSFEALGDRPTAVDYYKRTVAQDSTTSWYGQNAQKRIAILQTSGTDQN